MADPKKPDNAPGKPVEGQWAKDAPQDPQAFVKRSLPAARERGEVKEMARGIERRDARIGTLVALIAEVLEDQQALTDPAWRERAINAVHGGK